MVLGSRDSATGSGTPHPHQEDRAEEGTRESREGSPFVTDPASNPWSYETTSQVNLCFETAYVLPGRVPEPSLTLNRPPSFSGQSPEEDPGPRAGGEEHGNRATVKFDATDKEVACIGTPGLPPVGLCARKSSGVTDSTGADPAPTGGLYASPSLEHPSPGVLAHSMDTLAGAPNADATTCLPLDPKEMHGPGKSRVHRSILDPETVAMAGYHPKASLNGGDTRSVGIRVKGGVCILADTFPATNAGVIAAGGTNVEGKDPESSLLEEWDRARDCADLGDAGTGFQKGELWASGKLPVATSKRCGRCRRCIRCQNEAKSISMRGTQELVSIRNNMQLELGEY